MRHLTVLLLVLGAVGVFATFVVHERSAVAAPLIADSYTGLTWDVGTMSLTTTSSGTALSAITVTYPMESVRTGCLAGGTLQFSPQQMPITNNKVSGSAFTLRNASGVTEVNVRIAVVFTDGGIAYGEFASDPAQGSNCPKRDVVWAAVAPLSTAAPQPAARFEGRVVSVNTDGTRLDDGSVSLSVGPDGRMLTDYRTSLPQSCASSSGLSAPAPITTGSSCWCLAMAADPMHRS